MNNSENIITNKFVAKSRGSLQSTLRKRFLLISLLPMALIASLSYQQAYKSLLTAAKDQLIHTSQLKIHFIQNWFDYRFLDSEAKAISNSSVSLL